MHRVNRTIAAVLSMGLLTSGCAGSDADEGQVAAWCDAVRNMYEAGPDLDRDPAEVDPAEYEAWVEQGEALFATPAPEDVRPQLELLQNPDSGATPDEINSASQHVTDFIEENCEGIDPAYFESSL